MLVDSEGGDDLLYCSFLLCLWHMSHGHQQNRCFSGHLVLTLSQGDAAAKSFKEIVLSSLAAIWARAMNFLT